MKQSDYKRLKVGTLVQLVVIPIDKPIDGINFTTGVYYRDNSCYVSNSPSFCRSGELLIVTEILEGPQYLDNNRISLLAGDGSIVYIGKYNLSYHPSKKRTTK
jgi:hypothetical protein